MSTQSRNARFGAFAALTLMAAFLAGCSGGSGGNGGGGTPGTAPAIATQPQSQTVNAGASASFTVAATGTAPLNYQWTKNSTAISGATSATLQFGAVATGDAGSYAVTVTNAYGSATSSAATLTVNPPPQQAATPAFSPAGGSYTSAQTVTITDATSGASIYYTTDGSAPTAASTKYTAPITVSQTTTLNAIAIASGYTNSAVATATYTINFPAAATPAFSPAGGTYTSAQTVTITDATSGASIYYTTDGSAPTASSTKYTAPISVSQTTTLNAIAIASGYTNSAVASATYTINLPAAATPVFSPAGGNYTSAQTVTITDATSGASIYYTTDGSTPTASSTKYTAPIAVSSTTTLNAIAIATGYTNSAVANATYSIAGTPAATPVFSPTGGTYTSTQTVTITDATSGASIYYTTDGSTPTAASTKYTAPITVSSTTTLNAIAIASGYTNSAVATAVFSFGLNTLFKSYQYAPPLTTIPSPAPGGHVWYVDGVNGSDTNDGLSLGSAFKTIGRSYLPWLNKQFVGGDVVVILPATYYENIRICDNTKGRCWSNGPFVSLGGTASNYTIFMGMPCNGVLPGQGSCPRPILIGDQAGEAVVSNSVVQMWGPYIRVSGLEITSSTPGNPDDGCTVHDTTATFDATGKCTSTLHNRPNLCVSSLGGTTYVDSGGVIRPNIHHLIVDNNALHDCGSGGVSLLGSDYIIIQGNTVYNNVYWSVFGDSGISIGSMADYDNGPGYHAEILDNISYNNHAKIPLNFNRYGVLESCPSNAPLCDTDGNGIIADTQHPNPTYAGATLILGNVVFNNGGRGIAISGHNNADIINNTTYYNNQPNADIYQEFNPNAEIQIVRNDNIYPTNIHIYNNIIVPSDYPSKLPGFIYNPTFAYTPQQATIELYGVNNVEVKYNLVSADALKIKPSINTNAPSTLDSTNILADPLFVNAPVHLTTASTDPATVNFELPNGSPARWAGAPLLFDVYDVAGRVFYSPANAASNPNGQMTPNIGAYMQ